MAQLTRYQDATHFLAEAGDYLEAEEVVNSLLLGISRRLESRRSRRRQRPFLATVREGDELTLAAILTPPHNLVLYSHYPRPESALQAMAQALQEAALSPPGVLGPKDTAEAFAQLWSEVATVSYHPGMRQRLFELRQVQPVEVGEGRLRAANSADRQQVAQWVYAFQREALPHEEADEEASRLIAGGLIDRQDLYLWEVDGEAVSMAARSRPTRRGIAVNLVYTPPAERGNGYATACVAALSARLLAGGYEFITLFTDLSNPTSNHIYQRIGFRPVADFNEYRFDNNKAA